MEIFFATHVANWFGRVCNQQVRAAETEIRKKYPEAAYVDLEPDSSTHALYALEQYQTPALKKVQYTGYYYTPD